MLFKNKKIRIAALGLVVMIAVLTAVHVMNARAEVIHEETNPQFKYYIDYTGDPMGNGGWYPNPDICKLSYDEVSKNYSFTSNSYVMWGLEDNASYAYNKYRLAHGDQSKMKITTKILEHTAADAAQASDVHQNASIGICIRGTTENEGIYNSNKASQSLYLHCRAGNEIMIVYRTKDGAATVPASTRFTITEYPVYLTIEKEGNAIRCSAKCGENGVEQKFPTIFMTFTDIVTAGMVAHSVYETVPITSVFTDYNLKIEGPMGSTYEPVTDTSSGGGSGGENLDDVIPEDPIIPGDGAGILFRETFTDGSLTNESEDGRVHVDNPIWTNEYSIDGDIENATIVTEGDNRYWHRLFANDAYIFPNLDWSDYAMSLDLKFGPDTNLEQANEVDLYVRVNAARATGYYGYRIAMATTSKLVKDAVTGEQVLDDTQTITIYKICGRRSLTTTDYKTNASVQFDYISDDWRTWRIEAFDNCIRVYCEDTLVLEFEEKEGEEIGSYAVNGKGGIGIGSGTTDLMVDNIIVREMEDLMGGDFDNSISGRWEQPIPDYWLDYKYKIK